MGGRRGEGWHDPASPGPRRQRSGPPVHALVTLRSPTIRRWRRLPPGRAGRSRPDPVELGAGRQLQGDRSSEEHLGRDGEELAGAHRPVAVEHPAGVAAAGDALMPRRCTHRSNLEAPPHRRGAAACRPPNRRACRGDGRTRGTPRCARALGAEPRRRPCPRDQDGAEVVGLAEEFDGVVGGEPSADTVLAPALERGRVHDHRADVAVAVEPELEGRSSAACAAIVA